MTVVKSSEDEPKNLSVLLTPFRVRGKMTGTSMPPQDGHKFGL